MADIKVYKLVSGEEIVGTVVESEQNFVSLEKVRAIHLVPQGNNQFGVAMMPYVTSDPNGAIKIYAHAVSAEVVKVPADLEKTYMMQTSSIQIASTLMEGVK